MDELYIQPDRMSYDSELSGFEHDISSASKSLFLELIDKNTVKSAEQRSHKRFQVDKDAFALIRPASAKQLRVADKSMAEIACAVYRSKPVKFGRIDNISMGGLSFRYISSDERSGQSLVLDILVADSGFFLENLAFKNIADIELDDGFEINSFKMGLNRVQFEGLEPAAFIELKHFFKNYSVSGVKK